MRQITAASLGDAQFKADYGLKYAYLAGAMYKGIASQEMVVALGKAGFMGFLGTGGLSLEAVEASIRYIQAELTCGESYGMNLLASPERPDIEERTVDLYLEHGIRHLEAAAFMSITPALVRYRLKGTGRSRTGEVHSAHRIVAKVSHPEVAAAFMQPAPQSILKSLRASGQLSELQAELGGAIPVADDVCVEADSGGHTDRGVAFALLPAIMMLRDQMMEKHGYRKRIRVGAAGGIGTPHAAAAAFMMGADFILTGSINQCTREAGTSDDVKALLQQLDVHDTAHAPAGDMFELGAKVQVVKRGLLFPARANRLYELYQRHGSLDEIDPAVLQQIEDKYFRRSIDEVWEETKSYLARLRPTASFEVSPKRKMALIFKWYFVHSTRLALRGVQEQRVDYQIHCGPALGAFNQWVRNTEIFPWQKRYVADIAQRLLEGTAEHLNRWVAAHAGTLTSAHPGRRTDGDFIASGGA